MSVSPKNPLPALFAGLSAEELITAEEEHQLDPELLITPPVLGKRAARTEDDDSDDGAGRSPSPESENDPNPGNHTDVSALRMEQAARRLKKRLKLSSEHASLVEQFVQVRRLPFSSDTCG
jgi:hypothetical protein